MKRRCRAVLAALLMLTCPQLHAGNRLQVAVTLHPYYSWTARIGGEHVEVLPMIPDGADAHAYQPRAVEVERLSGVNAVVMNGAGHDAFADTLLAAAQTSAVRIHTNVGVPLIRSASGGYNSHTFLSLLAATQQLHTIAQALGRLLPEHEAEFAANARVYAQQLRELLRRGLQQIAPLNADQLRVAAVHDGYAYLLTELGVPIAEVIQPRHGVDPSAKQLADSIDRIRAAKVRILFTEADYGGRFAEVIRKATGTQVVQLRHMSRGPHSADRFEVDMAHNVDAIVSAIRATQVAM